MESPQKIIDLVEKFESNKERYRNQKYNETTTKQEFINLLFIELGWNINNTKRNAPQYKDAILKDSIKIARKTKSPDYCLV